MFFDEIDISEMNEFEKQAIFTRLKGLGKRIKGLGDRVKGLYDLGKEVAEENIPKINPIKKSRSAVRPQKLLPAGGKESAKPWFPGTAADTARKQKMMHIEPSGFEKIPYHVGKHSEKYKKGLTHAALAGMGVGGTALSLKYIKDTTQDAKEEQALRRRILQKSRKMEKKAGYREGRGGGISARIHQKYNPGVRVSVNRAAPFAERLGFFVGKHPKTALALAALGIPAAAGGAALALKKPAVKAFVASQKDKKEYR